MNILGWRALLQVDRLPVEVGARLVGVAVSARRGGSHHRDFCCIGNQTHRLPGYLRSVRRR